MAKMTDTKKERPLSPHLQVYKPQLTSLLSVGHRAAGFALAVGTVLVIWMLAAAATGPEAFSVFTGFIDSKIGHIMLLGWSLAFFFHFSNGIRHLFWDTGRLLSIKSAYAAGYLVLLSTALMTAAFWWSKCDVLKGLFS